MRVCIDPGHGGYDPGAVGNGLQEKDITLDIALRLRPLLIFNGIEVVMTRDGDFAPGHLENQLNAELAYRAKISNDFGADLFNSIHVNSGGGTGEEDLVQGLGGRAETAAGKLLYYLQQIDGWQNRGVKVQNVEVLRETNAPAVLVENGFIDNVSDANKLKDPNFRQLLAVAIAKGDCDFFGIAYKEKGVSIVADTKTTTLAPDPDVYLSVRVRTSKADALITQLIAEGFATKKLELA